MGYELALHELAHWCMQTINVAMHRQLEGTLCLIPLVARGISAGMMVQVESDVRFRAEIAADSLS